MMTLDDAIQHCKEKESCSKCGLEHKQLREWLEELKFCKENQLTVEEIEMIELVSHYTRTNIWLSDYDQDILISTLRKLEEQKERLNND